MTLHVTDDGEQLVLPGQQLVEVSPDFCLVAGGPMPVSVTEKST